MVLPVKKYLFRRISGNPFTSPVNIFYRYNKQLQKEYLTVPTFFNSGRSLALLTSNNETLYKYILTKQDDVLVDTQPLIVVRTISTIIRIPVIVVTNYYSNLSTKEEVFELCYIHHEDMSTNMFKQFLEQG